MKRNMLLPRFSRTVSLILVVFVFLCGCEDVITVDLRDAEPQIVIEGYLSNVDSRPFLITRTTDFYNPAPTEGVTGAMVVVSERAGWVDTLTNYGGGSYWFSGYHEPIAGRTYDAYVTVDGQTFTASATMPELIPIDSLGAEYQEGGGVGTEEDEGYRLHVYFQDVAERADYARIKLHRNDYYYLYDGRYSDGNVVDYEYFFNVYQPGDEVFVELYSLSRTMYYYFLTLDEVWVRDEIGNFLDATPANPNTNWSGGALGYFGAFNVSRASGYVRETGQ